MKHKVQSISKKILADTITPVSIFLKIRDRFANSILLESSDYHGSENSLSYICCDPVAEFKVTGDLSQYTFPDGTERKISGGAVVDEIKKFMDEFEPIPLKESFIHFNT